MVPAPQTISELADRAGVAVGFVEELCEAGVLTGNGNDRPFNDGDVRRAQLIDACARAGMPVADIGEAIRRGTLALDALDRDYYERWEGRADLTYGELAEQAGVPWAFFRAVHVALGFQPGEPHERPRQDELTLLPAFAVALRFGIEEEALLRLLRVYGESLRRITRAETQLWHENIDVPAQRSGTSQRDVLIGGAEFGQEIMSVIDQAVLSIYHRMQEFAWMEDLVEHIELGLEEAGVRTRLERPPAMCFVDLTGYTKLTEERGDEAAAELAASLGGIVQATVIPHDGHAVKWLGDGVMLSFRRAPDAVVAGARAGRIDRSPRATARTCRGARRTRRRARRGLLGRTVNLASRISGRAGPHEVLVTAEVVSESEGREVAFAPLGPIELKGVAAPVEVFRASHGP